jgi:hypothetical protein
MTGHSEVRVIWLTDREELPTIRPEPLAIPHRVNHFAESYCLSNPHEKRVGSDFPDSLEAGRADGDNRMFKEAPPMATFP